MSGWDLGTPGVFSLPSGRLVRGRGLRLPLPDGLLPEFAVHLLSKRPEAVSWESRWIRWPDFGLPTNRRDARNALTEAWRRAAQERVEIACAGGRGRTGTALACLAVLDGVPAAEAVAYIRGHYDSRAVETPWQRRYARHFVTP
ncbi:MAG: protein-tyrosine phosphatase family protein [Micrococcales bacterium]|nr:protein-tyrosine phosphatase family protein [Micrococcales bacterium]